MEESVGANGLYVVDVYYNLRSKVWSVKNRETGVVACHGSAVIFAFPVVFVVGAAGRKRVLVERQKNVHAFVRGNSPLVYESDRVEFWDDVAVKTKGMELVSYNPYKGDSFYRCSDGAAISQASSVVMIAELGKSPKVYALESK